MPESYYTLELLQADKSLSFLIKRFVDAVLC
jgi:hypothetical protein